MERLIWNSETALAVLCVSSRGCWSSRKKKPKTARKKSVNWKFYCVADLQSLRISMYLTFTLFPILGGLLESDSCAS